MRRKFAKMLQHLAVDILIPGAAILSIIFGVCLWYRVSKIQVSTGSQGLRADGTRGYLLEEEQRGEDEVQALDDASFMCASQAALCCIKINLISHAGSTSRQQYSLQGHEAAGGDVGTVLIHSLSRQP